MRKLIFLFALISTFVLGQTPNGSRKAWTDTLKISYNNQFVDILDLSRDSLHVVEDTVALKLYSGKGTVYLRQLSSSNSGGTGIYFNIDSMYPEPLFAFDAFEQGKQWVRQDLLGKRPYYAIDYGVVPEDSTYSASNTDILNALFLENYTGSNKKTKTGIVVLPAGTVWLEKTPGTNYCLNIQAGRVMGSGGNAQVNGTVLKVRANQVSSGDTLKVIVNEQTAAFDNTGSYTGWWHWSGLSNIGINCNGNKQSGIIAALDIHRPGEASYLENIVIGGYKGWGLRVKGNAAPPLRIAGMSSNPATLADTTGAYAYSERKSYWFDSSGNVNATGLSGDTGRPLVYIGSGGNGAIGVHVKIDGLKHESAAFSTPGSFVSRPVVIDTVTAIGSSIDIQQITANNQSVVAGFANRVVEITGTGATQKPFVNLRIAQASGFRSLLYWNFGGVADSVVDNLNTAGNADQRGGWITWGAPTQFLGGIQIKDRFEGFYYENKRDSLIHTLRYASDNYFHITAPGDSTVIETAAGTDIAQFHPNRVIVGKPLRVGGFTSGFAIIDSIKIENNLLKFWVGGIKYSAIAEDSLINFRN